MEEEGEEKCRVDEKINQSIKRIGKFQFKTNGKFYSSQIEDYNPGTADQKALRTHYSIH